MSLPTFGEYMSAGFKFSLRSGFIDLDRPPYPSEIQLNPIGPIIFSTFIPMSEITSLSELGMR
jgi:hypothetical protein